MIFVILGTQKFQLNRLLRLLDQYIDQGIIQEEVVAQIGYSDYLPKRYKYYDFLNKDEFDDMISNADIVITHSGVGSIITALNANKPVIVYPRLAKYKEHVDDHQLDIARAFSKKNFVLLCGEEENLSSLVDECRDKKFDKYISQRQRLVSIIQKYLEQN